jgi:hypothetical protein
MGITILTATPLNTQLYIDMSMCCTTQQQLPRSDNRGGKHPTAKIETHSLLRSASTGNGNSRRQPLGRIVHHSTPAHTMPAPWLHSTACCTGTRLLVGGVVVWLAGHAHLSCLNLRQWTAIGADIHSFIHLWDQATRRPTVMHGPPRVGTVQQP